MTIVRMIPTESNIKAALFFVNNNCNNPISISIIEEDAAHIFLVRNVNEETIGIIGYGYRKADYDEAYTTHWNVDFFVMANNVDYADMYTLIRDSIKDKYDVPIYIDLKTIDISYRDTAANAFKNNKFKIWHSLNVNDKNIDPELLIRDPRFLYKK